MAKRKVIDVDGTPIVTVHDKTMYNHRQYKVEFLNGDTEVLTATIIAENRLAQVDEEGYRQMLLKKIIDHYTLKDAIPKSEGTFKTNFSTVRKKCTTRV